MKKFIITILTENDLSEAKIEAYIYENLRNELIENGDGDLNLIEIQKYGI